jgi:hypothetical protein
MQGAVLSDRVSLAPIQVKSNRGDCNDPIRVGVVDYDLCRPQPTAPSLRPRAAFVRAEGVGSGPEQRKLALETALADVSALKAA